MDGNALNLLMMEQMTDGLIVFNKENKVVFVNSAVEKIRNISRKDLIGLDIYQCHPGVKKDKIDRALDYIKSRGQELRRISRDGIAKTAQENLFRAIYDENQEYSGLMAITRDISEKYNLDENKLIMMQQMDEQIKNLRARFNGLFLSSLETLVNTLEAKDRYTKGHSMRVSAICEKFLSLEPFLVPVTQNVLIAAKLHDIGKIGVSEAVLSKSGKLTDGEYEEMKRHPLMTASILEPMDELRDVVTMAKHHHERYDGKGYPDGLKGESIPVGARLLALADSYDAMSSTRPYRDCLTFEQVLREIRSNLGSQFDPQLGEKFLLHLELGNLDQFTFS